MLNKVKKQALQKSAILEVILKRIQNPVHHLRQSVFRKKLHLKDVWQGSKYSSAIWV